ncbi:MAG: hypothetical protein KKE98_00600 [Nanoarchaeota archaeon]|nr:hypothetical protein [Nanoarchaeota archaeon]MBU1269362.1 hypothetical protein [Nanoarchaeota archaeon]MBU1596922.1 hypothetical protein [Nanoarchaeota archaeon]MBU2442361.1 hypothetical protein [Nanoarchaeota archaeon]
MPKSMEPGNPKIVNVHKYLFVLTLTIIIFAAGVLVGNSVASAKISSIQNLGQTLRTDILALELQYNIMESDPCRGIGFGPLLEELYTLGSRLDFMESKSGFDNDDVVRLKQYYSLVELRHWLFIKKLNTECNQENNVILYFYSNKGDCPKCEDQGHVLSYLHNKYPGLMIYSFDKNLNNPALEAIRNDLNIQEAPTIVINDDVYPGYQTRSFLEKLLNYSVENEQITE